MVIYSSFLYLIIHLKYSPECRSVCYMTPEEAPINAMIKSIAMAVDPELYARRLVEYETEKKNWDTTTPIFYFNGASMSY